MREYNNTAILDKRLETEDLNALKTLGYRQNTATLEEGRHTDRKPWCEFGSERGLKRTRKRTEYRGLIKQTVPVYSN